MPTPKYLHKPSKRLARLTGSPRQPNFIFLWQPMLPLSTVPVCMPMRMDTRGRPTLANSMFRSASEACIASAAAQALAAWSSTRSGVFQKMSRPSPRISVSDPLCASTTAVITDKYRVKKNNRSAWDSDSEIDVKSRMSVNMIVTVRSDTCGCVARLSPSMMLRTTDSGTKRANASTPVDSLRKVLCSWPTSLMMDRLPVWSSSMALLS
mmetsp:Transcript_589/g.1923  ORF Transcript_589/g.1923 Transcript_589/m.1923 type:complete len:209 (-) Transcript_589:1763-2389(-)